jgi:hypothetical protein
MSTPETPEPPAAPAGLLDCLLPGDGGRWPAFSRAVDVDGFGAAIAPPLAASLDVWAARVGDLPAEHRTAVIAAIEAAEPVAFQALLTAAYRAYYTALKVLEAVTMLADAGPREPSPHFDPALVATVLATEAGKRRL